MFDRFTDRARHVFVLAREEAVRLQHNYIGTEHILLGLTGESEGLGAKTLLSFDLTLEQLRAEVEEVVGKGPEPIPDETMFPFTDRAKTVIELSLRECMHLSHDYIATEHVLLALVREGEGMACQVLVKVGVALPDLREKTLALLKDEANVVLKVPDITGPMKQESLQRINDLAKYLNGHMPAAFQPVVNQLNQHTGGTIQLSVAEARAATNLYYGLWTELSSGEDLHEIWETHPLAPLFKAISKALEEAWHAQKSA